MKKFEVGQTVRVMSATIPPRCLYHGTFQGIEESDRRPDVIYARVYNHMSDVENMVPLERLEEIK